MSNLGSKKRLVGRLPVGDEQACLEFYDKYAAAIRRRIRVTLRLMQADARRVIEAMDVCQSVQLDVSDRAANGDSPLECPQKIVRLLSALTDNRVPSSSGQAIRTPHSRRPAARTKDGRRGRPRRAETPAELFAQWELIDIVREKLTAAERRLAGLRARGYSWDEIAGQIGNSADACYDQFNRGMERVIDELALSSNRGVRSGAKRQITIHAAGR